MTDKILFVDDEPNILSAYTRQLRTLFKIDTALGGQEGLAVIRHRGPYAVIISDFRMPGMDGAQFLARAQQISPESVRIMLTGNADIDTAMAAVNEGNIFRFLTKPCPPGTLAKALEASIEQHHLIISERELLEDTLMGSVKVLTDILSLVNPKAFSRADRIKGYVRHMANRLNLPDRWQFEMAAMLSLIGCVTLPQETLEKALAGYDLSENEKSMYNTYPLVGKNLLAKIPRLEKIAAMIEKQQEPFIHTKTNEPPHQRDVVSLGAQMLKIALDFDMLVTRGTGSEKSIAKLYHEPDVYDPAIVSTLENVLIFNNERKYRLVHVREIDTSMILAENVQTKSGLLLASKGQEITYPVIERLRNFSRGVGIVEPFQVLIRGE